MSEEVASNGTFLGLVWPTKRRFWKWGYSHVGSGISFVTKSKTEAIRLVKYWGSK